jgi:hypothetical protein
MLQVNGKTWNPAARKGRRPYFPTAFVLSAGKIFIRTYPLQPELIGKSKAFPGNAVTADGITTQVDCPPRTPSFRLPSRTTGGSGHHPVSRYIY